MEIKQVFPSIYKLVNNNQEIIVTRNLTPGIKYYGEPVYDINGIDYRSWNPTRSKLSAMILKGAKNMPIKPESMVLYLGVASGTTLSHISDIVGHNGHIWGVDFAPRSMRDLLDKVTRYRNNISPILADARNPTNYSSLVSMVDVVFADVAQPDQGKIIVDNSKHFLKKNGWLILSIKARSVDVREKPKNVYEKQIQVIEDSGYIIHEVVELDPFEKDHAIVLASFV
jgi:fibrillarin-like pre-rRNA processing protein